MTFELRIKPGNPVKLADIDSRDTRFVGDEPEARRQLAEDVNAINQLQDSLFAESNRAVLIILQGMDTSGKDGTIRGVFNTTGPMGVNVTPFRAPSAEELRHDFLWRAHQAAPRKGMIGIFNRSHYEDVLVARVRTLVPHHVIEQRYAQINAFETLLSETGTVILKFMLHISKDEQKTRLQERLDDPKKRWKFQPADLEDRAKWHEFRQAYDIMLERCATDHAPWHIIPADHKWARNAAIAKIVRAELEKMDPKYPVPNWSPDQFVIE